MTSGDDETQILCYNDYMRPGGDVIILGGGVIGLTTAYFLARDGASVVLCDQAKTGMEASWAGAGILPPSDLDHAQYPADRLRAISGKLFPDLSAELKDRAGIDNGFSRCGGLEFLGHSAHVATDEWYGLGVATSVLSEKEVAALEPALAPGIGQAISVPGMAQLRNPRHLQALKAACLATQKVTLLEETRAHELIREGRRIKGVHTSSEVLAGDAFLVAAGAWTDRLLEPLGCRLKIEPVRGQIVLLNPGKVVFRRILLWCAQYLVPRLDGRVLIGSTEEYAGFDRSTTPEAVRRLFELGVRLVPSLVSATLEKRKAVVLQMLFSFQVVWQRRHSGLAGCGWKTSKASALRRVKRCGEDWNFCCNSAGRLFPMRAGSEE